MLSESEQDLGGVALVHGLVALSGLIEWQLEVEDLAGVDLAVPDQLDGEITDLEECYTPQENYWW